MYLSVYPYMGTEKERESQRQTDRQTESYTHTCIFVELAQKSFYFSSMIPRKCVCVCVRIYLFFLCVRYIDYISHT